MTPEEVLAYRSVGSRANGPGWDTRVVPDRKPLMTPEGSLQRKGISIYDRMNTCGYHEIVIETPEHNATMETIEPRQLEQVLWAYRDRIEEMRKDPRITHVLMVKNSGRDAGSSFSRVHPHSHILGFPVVPKRVVDKFRGAQKFFQFRERCIWCDMLIQEQEQRERVVLENDHFLAFTPFASRFSYEVCIVPRRHHAHFEQISNVEIVHLADILKKTMKRIFHVLQAPAYNYIFFTAPWEHRYEQHFHWHIEIMPRISGIAGFEWGTGFYINPMAPEDAAQILREADV